MHTSKVCVRHFPVTNYVLNGLRSHWIEWRRMYCVSWWDAMRGSSKEPNHYFNWWALGIRDSNQNQEKTEGSILHDLVRHYLPDPSSHSLIHSAPSSPHRPLFHRQAPTSGPSNFLECSPPNTSLISPRFLSKFTVSGPHYLKFHPPPNTYTSYCSSILYFFLLRN